MSSTAAASRLFAPRPRSRALVDVAIAAVALGASLALVWVGGSPALVSHGDIGASRPGAGELDLVGVVAVAMATVPLAAWRRRPFGVFALTASATVVHTGLGSPIGLALGPAAALYLLAASRDEASPWLGRTSAVVGGMLVAYLAASAAAQGAFPASELVHTGLAWAVAWFGGERSRLRRAHIAELKERAASAERAAERERLLAAAQERARIARDVHDSAGHAINVIVVRAGAARLRHHQDPDRSLLALEAIEETARQTAGEIEQIVGTLREGGAPDGDVESPPGLRSLETLIAQHGETGLDVTLDTTGHRRALGGPADQAAYRIVQEALTNAARHGAGSARLELAFADAALQLTITNPAPAGARPRAGGGRGLVGMRERTTLLGGTLEAAQVNGTFRVRARIPYGGPHA